MTLETIAESPVRSVGRTRQITGGKLTGQKPALKMKEVWSIRARLELRKRIRDLALFNLAIDSKLRGCDLICQIAFNTDPVFASNIDPL